MNSEEQQQIPLEEFDVISDWLALDEDCFRRQIAELRSHPRIQSKQTRQAIDITIQALEALHRR